MEEQICCQEFKPNNWQDKEFSWENKQFVVSELKTFMYMPLGFGKLMTRIQKLLNTTGTKNIDGMCLSSHSSKWRMNLYTAVDKPISQVENIMLSGNYYSKVYDGPFQETGKWCADFEKSLIAKGYSLKQMYMWYTTCPKCAKKYGHNYVVIIGEI